MCREQCKTAKLNGCVPHPLASSKKSLHSGERLKHPMAQDRLVRVSYTHDRDASHPPHRTVLCQGIAILAVAQQLYKSA